MQRMQQTRPVIKLLTNMKVERKVTRKIGKKKESN